MSSGLTNARAGLRRPDAAKEYSTRERCFINPLVGRGEPGEVSIALARVPPGVTTELHRLKDTDERYLVISGRGRMMVGDSEMEIRSKDVVLIPANVGQRVESLGPEDLEFYCVCTPPFVPECYEPLE
jgi:mannose-6-phosphate isomerase-like protein (cupin superfamily)